MNQLELINQVKDNGKKVGRKVKLAISSLSPEERLDSLADVIIERIIEENSIRKQTINPNNEEVAI